ncbi:hypothetical protein GQ54DRAFT_267276, partial [Martensiomyces pterosporus]
MRVELRDDESYEGHLQLVPRTFRVVTRAAKYKPVAEKVRPVAAPVPDGMQLEVEQETRAKLKQGTVLDDEAMTKLQIGDGNLTEAEDLLFRSELKSVESAIAFSDEEMGLLKPDVEPPVRIPTVPHEPWNYKPYPVGRGLFDRVVNLLKVKMDAGVIEPTIGPYASRWFVIAKKDKSKLRF